MKEYNRTFAINLKVVREARGMTQSELSKKANLKLVSRVRSIEDFRADCSLQEVINICNILNVPMESMIKHTAEVKIQFQTKSPITGKIEP